ncbi:MAG TPA: YlxM family DNA-binding protein [Mobilitalea sp.]|nr:YlxM family DNA-binding protein [Mobilitalea sp.]
MQDTISGDSKLDELIYLSMLYDFYGDLLPDNKKQVFEDYVLNDLSLSEIAEHMNISRQGVHDIVKRCTQELKDYEEKLSLLKKFAKIKDMLESIKDLCYKISETGEINKLHEIAALADDILKEL